MVQSITNETCNNLADKKRGPKTGIRLLTMGTADAKRDIHKIHLKNSSIRMALSGCFQCYFGEIHCTKCHKTTTSENASQFLGAEYDQREQFHYSNICYSNEQTDTTDTKNTSISKHLAKATIYPQYATLNSRKKTFIQCPYSIKNGVEPLAGAGFFYKDPKGQENSVYCFCCGNELRTWTFNESPYQVHRDWFFSCTYINSIDFLTAESDYQKKTLAVDTNNHYLMTPAAQALLTFNYSPIHIIEATNTLSMHHAKNSLTSQDILSYIIDFILPRDAMSDHPAQGATGYNNETFMTLESGNVISCSKDTSAENTPNNSRLDQAIAGATSNYQPKKASVCPSKQNPLPSCSGIDIHTQEQPKYLNYRYLYDRKKSFANWPSNNKPTTDSLAEAGFWYIDVEDCVRCFFCGGGLREWRANSDPKTEHLKWYPHCPYLITEVFNQPK